MAEEFKYNIKIIESHLDTFGHVNNATYLELYEEARWDFITQNGWGLNEVKTNKIGPVILDLQLSFKRELLNRETICIHSQFKETKNQLVGVLMQKMVNEQNQVASTLELSVGLMDLKQRKLIKPTLEWFKAIGAPEYFLQND